MAPSNANTSGLAEAWARLSMTFGERFYESYEPELEAMSAAVVTAASAQTRIAELEAELSQANANGASHWSRATAAEARADRLAEIASKLSAAISWLDYPFIDNRTPEAELRQRVGFMMKDAEPHRAALQQETQP